MNRRHLLSACLTAATLGVGALAAPYLTPIPTLPPGSPGGSLPEIQPVQPNSSQEIPPLTPTSSPTAQPSVPAAPTVKTGLTDPIYPQQWNLNVIRAPEAWTLSQGGPVTVAVLDTGFVNSPELTGRVVNGYDFVSNASRAGDGNGRDPDASGVGPEAYHGEVIANIIAAAHDGRGMAGVNPQARIVHARIAGVDGTVDPADLADAIRWAAGIAVPGVPANPNPARLLNISAYADFIPLTGCDARIQNAVSAATGKGALVIAGAANDAQNASGYSPAGCRNVLTVTSITPQGTRPAYANWGSSVALAAPGGETGAGLIASTVKQPTLELRGGTSLSAPQVTGAASLILAQRPRLSPYLLRSYLTRTATPFPGGQCDPNPAHTCGSGTLNAYAALKAALSSTLGK